MTAFQKSRDGANGPVEVGMIGGLGTDLLSTERIVAATTQNGGAAGNEFQTLTLTCWSRRRPRRT